MARQAVRCATRVLAITTLLVATSASAQWVWKDEGGHVVASDQPPPTSVPQSRIVKQPSARAQATPSASAGGPAPAADAPKSLADRELESRQRDKEQAEASKKAEEEATRARAMQDNCASVRGNLAALQAGGRAARFNEKGERIYLDDSQRGAEIAKSQQQVAQYCRQG